MNVCASCASVEVILQYSEIEQNLHVMLLQVFRAVVVESVVCNIEVLSRLLFHKQTEVGCH